MACEGENFANVSYFLIFEGHSIFLYDHRASVRTCMLKSSRVGARTFHQLKAFMDGTGCFAIGVYGLS